MSSNTIFSSAESEKRWVLAMKNNFPHDHILDIDFDTPFCVFTVPKVLSESKPEAYAPQHLGLGPYHHLRPDLYTTTQNKKLAAVTKFLGPENLHKIQLMVDALVRSEPLLRSCYDHYLDLDIQTLSWILAIDAVFLLQFLNNYSCSPRDTRIETDILMVENQIPVVLLKKIRRILDPADGDDSNSSLLYEKFQVFCRDNSPLELNEYITGNVNQVHLLHHMYDSIVSNVTIQSPFSTYSLQLGDVVDGVYFLAEQGLPGAGITAQILSFMQKIPWGKISGLFKKGNSDEQNRVVEEIDIPSVSQMSRVAGIKFTVLASGGIREIKFDEDEKKFYLPVIKLSADSEVILRNLVAYEAASMKPGSTLEFAEYVDLMCGIVDGPEDVDILKREKIVESELSDEEIARIFNGISRSVKKNENTSNIEEVIDTVNTRYDSICGVRVKRFVVKYGCASLKFVSLVISAAVLVLLVLRAFCSVFGCDRLFGEITARNSNLLLSSY